MRSSITDNMLDTVHGFFDWLMTLFFILAFFIALAPLIFLFGGIEAVIKALKSDGKLPFQN